MLDQVRVIEIPKLSRVQVPPFEVSSVASGSELFHCDVGFAVLDLLWLAVCVLT
jgi:hypothetical protein